VLGGLKAIKSYRPRRSCSPHSLAIICAPPLDLMQRHKLPGPLRFWVLFFGRGPDLFPAVSCLKDAAESMRRIAAYQARFNGWMIELAPR